MNDVEKHTLLICTVGSSHEPIVAAVKHWKPVKVRFVTTPEVRRKIDEVVQLAQSEGLSIDPGRYDEFLLPDGQDFSGCVEALRALSPIVEEWLDRGDSFQVVVDFTGGTKCMSAALALQAHRWPCLFSYVGGDERTKDGVGIVVSGREQVIHAHNPWDALGFGAVDEYATLFDQRAFASAAALSKTARDRATAPARKKEFQALVDLAEAYDFWDRFRHKDSLVRFSNLAKSWNDLAAILGSHRAQKLEHAIRSHREWLQNLTGASSPSREIVLDLIANARRRRDEGRLDDAVARLYRAIEAVAQHQLAIGHGLSKTSEVPAEKVPSSLRGKWESKIEDGTLALALQDDYELLAALGDPLAGRFRELNLHDRNKSPLTARNQSIYAHGFEPVSEKVCENLWSATLALAGVSKDELVTFPRLRST